MTSCPAAADLTFETTKASADDKIGRRFFLQFSADSTSPGRQSANRFPPQQRASGARRTDLSSTAHPPWTPVRGQKSCLSSAQAVPHPASFSLLDRARPVFSFSVPQKKRKWGVHCTSHRWLPSPPPGGLPSRNPGLLRQGRFFFATAWRRCTAPLPPAADRYSIASTLRALAHTWSPTAAQRVPECS